VSRFASLYGDRIIGVLNADMLGYSAPGYKGAAILSNYLSGWFAEMVRESAEIRDPLLSLAVALPGPQNFDHASFWDSSLTAVTLTEPLDEHWGIIYPMYHTLGDTLLWIDFGLVERLTNLIVGFVADVGAAPAEIAIFPTDVTIFLNGSATLSRRFATGDSIGVRVRVRNRGGAEVPSGASGRVVISVENDQGVATLASEAIDLPEALGFRDIMISKVLGDEFIGANRLRAEVFVHGMDDARADNAQEVWMGVEGALGPILMHAVQPNPIGGTFRSASFCINLARGVNVGLELYTIEGERLGSAYIGARWGRPLEAGMNCMELGSLFPDIDRLASGVYLYRLVAYDDGTARSNYAGRFAVEN
jgi:hypothetical protein